MKKKLALLLAAIMIIGTPMTAMAASSHYVDNGALLATYGSNSVVFDNRLTTVPIAASTYLTNLHGFTYNNGVAASTTVPVGNNGTGLNLVITFTGDVSSSLAADQSFKLTYENAYHAFYSNGGYGNMLNSSVDSTSRTYSDLLYSVSGGLPANSYPDNAGYDATAGLKYYLSTGERPTGGTTTQPTGDIIDDAVNYTINTVIAAGLAAVKTAIAGATDATTINHLYIAYEQAVRTATSANHAVFTSQELNLIYNAALDAYSEDLTIAGTPPTVRLSIYNTVAAAITPVIDTTMYPYNSSAALNTALGIATTLSDNANIKALADAWDAGKRYVSDPVNGDEVNPQTITVALNTAYAAITAANVTALGNPGGLTAVTKTFSAIVDSASAPVDYTTTGNIYTRNIGGIWNFTNLATGATDDVALTANTSTALREINLLMQAASLKIADEKAAATTRMNAFSNAFAFTNDGVSGTRFGTVKTFLEDLRDLYNSSAFTRGTTTTTTGSAYYDAIDIFVHNTLGKTDNKAIGYNVSVDPNDPTTAIITVPKGTEIKAGDVLVFPMVMLTRSYGSEVKYTMTAQTALFNSSAQTTIGYTGSRVGTTNNRFLSTANAARGRIYLGDLAITERSLNQITDGSFYIVPPSGYDIVRTNDFAVVFDAAFRGFGSGSGTVVTSSAYLTSIANAGISNASDYWSYFKGHGSVMRVTLSSLPTSRSALGTITIEGIALNPLSNDPELYGNIDEDLYVGVFASSSYVETSTYSLTGISTGELVAATRQEWNISITSSDIANLYSGKTGQEAGYITIQETVLDSWNARKDTTFTLTDADGNALDGVKITAVQVLSDNLKDVAGVEFDKTSSYGISANIYNEYGKWYENTDVNGTYSSSPVEYSNASFSRDGHTFRSTDLYTTENTFGKMKLWFLLSAEANFEGDVYVTVGGPGVSDNDYTTVENAGIVQIATFYPPVTISTQPTEVQIGYQMYKLADVVITENFDAVGESAFETGKKIQIALGEYGQGKLTSYMYFSPISKSDVTITGDSQFNISEINQVNLLSYSYGWNQKVLEFTVMRKSKNVGAEITVTNLGLNIDREPPEGNYDLLVGGDAIVNNWIPSNTQYYYLYDMFDVFGVVEPGYIVVKTAGANVAKKNRVELTAGSYDILVNGEVETLPVPVMLVDDRMYVPLRFVAVAMNVPDESIIFDDGTRKALIITSERTITFTQNSPYYTINGIELRMFDDGVEAQAFIEYDRMYIPVKYVCYALDVPLTWVEEDKVAILNYDASDIATAVEE